MVQFRKKDKFKDKGITWELSWLKGPISYERFKGISFMQFHTKIMLYWYIVYDDSDYMTGWLYIYCLHIGISPCFSCHAIKFLADVCECYKCLYDMFIEIMHARMCESKIWSMCISTYSMCMHDHAQEWRKIIRTCKETYRASTSQSARAVLYKTWTSPWPDLKGIDRWESRGK